MPPLRVLDSLGGLALGAAAGAAIVWVAGAVALHTPGQTQWREEVQRSRILSEINERVPPSRLLDAIAARGLHAKIRTGGITPDAFPAIDDIAGFLRACKAKGVAFKATAGLHHPLRCVKPLTYEPNAPTGTMHGFINVFLAAALLDHADEVLAEADPRAFAFDDDGVSWRGHSVSTEELIAMRRDFATSFGSCSFEEPIGDLKELGWL